MNQLSFDDLMRAYKSIPEDKKEHFRKQSVDDLFCVLDYQLHQICQSLKTCVSSLEQLGELVHTLQACHIINTVENSSQGGEFRGAVKGDIL